LDKKISHEISNYLHQIISNAEFISSSDKDISEHIQKIKQSAYSIDALITDTTITKPTININENKTSKKELEKLANLNILVVDDIIENINIMKNIFSTLSCNIITTMNGEDAIKVFQDGFKPDIVCMDMVMPGMNGSDTTKELKAMGSQAYFIAISALKNQPEDITSLFDCWLPKPFTQEHIIGALLGFNPTKKKHFTPTKVFKVDLHLPKEIKEKIFYMADNGLYSKLKDFTNTLDDLKSKEFLISSLKKVDLEAIKKATL